ncbi:MAG: hypothetical protein ACLPVY_01575, partial [Acidimicrobiia bacterium]
FAIVAPSPPVGAASVSACTARTGVTVIVDFTHFRLDIERGCAPGHPANALDALEAAGFATAGTAQYGDAFLCRIDDLPSSAHQSCAQTPPATSSWSFYWARPTDTDWTYATAGVTGYQPPAGSLIGFAFGDDAEPGIRPTAVISAPTTSTSPAAPAPTAESAAVSVTTPPGRSSTTVVASHPSASTTTAAAPTRISTATGASGAASLPRGTPRLVERTASAVGHDSPGSPRSAVLALAVVAALSVGGWLTIRARRRRPA